MRSTGMPAGRSSKRALSGLTSSARTRSSASTIVMPKADW
jgi:hypothetical protein